MYRLKKLRGNEEKYRKRKKKSANHENRKTCDKRKRN